MIVCLIQQDFVSLQVLEPAKPLNDAQMCGSFYFYTLTILSIPVTTQHPYRKLLVNKA